MNESPPVNGPNRGSAVTRADVAKHWGTALLLVVLRGIALLPLWVSRGLGAGLGFLLYLGNAKRRRIARINLGLCFPALSIHERQRLLRRHFRRVGQAYIDIGFLVWAGERRFRRAVRVSGGEHLEAASAAKRRVILLAPHCIGMNVGGIAVARSYTVFSMVKPQRDPLVNWALNKARSRYGSPLINREAGLRPVVRLLTRGHMFYYLPDEDFGPKHSVFAPFFGLPTATLTTLGRLARLTDAVVLPCFAQLVPGSGGYEVTIHPPLTEFPSNDDVADAARMNRAIEVGIRTMPEQYMWTFKLFKTRPDGARSPYDP